MKEKKKKESGNIKILKRILIGLVVVIVVMFGAGAFYVYNMLNKIEKTDLDKADLGIEQVAGQKNKNITNIALFGVDAENGQRGRSDSIMILTLDNETNKIKLSSIMRDAYVNIPGYGMDKINHAYSFGGPQLAVKTINTNFGMNIEEFITVNFTSLPKIINSLGGIEIELTSGDLKYLNQYIGGKSSHINGPGKYNLDGEQALAYARIRYDGGDQQRTQRHRNVMEGMLDQVRSVSVSQIPGLLGDLFPFIETSFSSTEMISLATGSMGLLKAPMEQLRLPEDGSYKGEQIKGVYYSVLDIPATTDRLKEFIYNDK
ncbi:LCP family protein [uncultured Clostridium sp.]|uniref:LCP family protein n=1 Tax=uncultured Clostridium sp. TaxID=59620 RepID=UPI00262EF5BB|nr:LCP family protein [uncultured Clostridium sp.]